MVPNLFSTFKPLQLPHFCMSPLFLKIGTDNFSSDQKAVQITLKKKCFPKLSTPSQTIHLTLSKW